MQKEKTNEITVTRRSFFKIVAAAIAGAAISPKVLASLGVEEATSALTYADFMNAVSSLEQAHASSMAGGHYLVMHPELYKDLLNCWEQELTAILGEQMGLAIDRLILDEENPFKKAEYLVGEVGSFCGLQIHVSEDIPEDEVVFNWATAADDATLTIGVENA